MMWKDPARLSDGESETAALLRGYAARTDARGSDEGAAWRRLQPPLDARVRARHLWARTRLFAGALTLAFGLLFVARSATLARETGDAAYERRAASNEGAPGGGGASGALDGDSRGAGGMEGAGGGVRGACDGV